MNLQVEPTQGWKNWRFYGFGSFGVLRSKGLGLGATLKSLECNVKSL